MSEKSIDSPTEHEPFSSSRLSVSDEAFLAAHPWVRHYEEGVPFSIDLPEHPLTWILERAVQDYPEQTALIYYGRKLTYAQLARYADRFAGVLYRLGVRKGDRVALALPNIPHYPIAFYGALKAGAVVVPTNPLYTAREMQHQLADAGVRVLIVLDNFYPTVRALRPQTNLEHILLARATDFLPPLTRALYPLSQWGRKHLEPRLSTGELRGDRTLHVMCDLLEARKGDEACPPVPVKNTDLAVLQYTGGTTGLAKGAMLTHRNLLANALQTRAWIPRTREGAEVMLCAAPFFHAYGMTVCMNTSVLLAAEMVLLPRFHPREVVKTIRRYHPTLFPGIPTMYLAITRAAAAHPADLRSIKYCISGAAPLPAQVQADFEAVTRGKLVEGYGLSEAGPVTHCNPLTEQCRNGTVGLPFPGVEAAIIEEKTRRSLPIGEMGEIVVKGPNVMQGYWHNEEETRAVLVDGWLHTGDLGTMNEEGYFSLVERAKDVIIASGFKVYPREVEEVLFLHPAVSEAGVVGIPHAYRGETVAAFVVLKKGIKATAELKQDLLAHCARELTAYKVPTLLEFRANLPKSLIGKVVRRELRGEGK